MVLLLGLLYLHRPCKLNSKIVLSQFGQETSPLYSQNKRRPEEVGVHYRVLQKMSLVQMLVVLDVYVGENQRILLLMDSQCFSY